MEQRHHTASMVDGGASALVSGSLEPKFEGIYSGVRENAVVVECLFVIECVALLFSVICFKGPSLWSSQRLNALVPSGARVVQRPR